MKEASEKERSELKTFTRTASPDEFTIAKNLYTVVDAFVGAYEQRQKADYDNSKQWTRTEVLAQIATVEVAFESWRQIRDEDMAQDFLLRLLVKDR